jgi:hypothetical protein
VDHAEIHPDLDSDQTPPPPQIPWERRKQIGAIRAYWQTATMVMTRPSELSQLLDAPVCEKHAKKFRRVTVQLTFIITLSVLTALLVRLFMTALTQRCDMREVQPSGCLPILTHMGMTLLSLIGLFLATRSLEWFFSPRDFDPTRQNRAIALSCYACGPILIVAVIGAVASTIFVLLAPIQNMQTILGITNLAWWAIFLAWWPASVQAIHFTTGQNTKRTTIAAIALPAIWIGQQLLMGIIAISVFQWHLTIASLS